MKETLRKIMKRAWEIKKEHENNIFALCLKMAWEEERENKESKMNLEEKLVKNLEDMAYNDYHINAGIDRQVNTKRWTKNGNDRLYLTIDCYTANGRSKGSYKCGYIDLINNKYVCGRYDDVDAANKEYIGR